MGMIKGMTVVLVEVTQSGADDFGRPIYTETEVSVPDVLVGQPSTDDITTSVDLTGKRAAYILGIPKGDTHVWEDRKIRFFGKTWRSFGFTLEGIEENIPGKWHKKVMVELYE